MSKQIQKAGDNSTNLQAGSITVQGLTVSEARQIALDVFRANFFELAGEAKEIARRRAEEITEDFLSKLQAENLDGLQQAQEPDFQHGLFTVQKEYARAGEPELGALLVDLLVDRTKQPTRNILQIVLNESLAVAPKLTPDQLAALSIVFLFKYTIQRGIGSHEALLDYLDHYVAPFVGHLSAKAAGFQHLEYSGCGTVGIGSVNLGEVFRIHYGGLFSKGFDRAQLEAKQVTIPNSSSMFIQCVNDPSRLQVNAINVDVIRSKCSEMSISSEDTEKLVALHNETLMAHNEVQEHIVKSRDYMNQVFEIWSNSSMNVFTLTSVGIAIGHANIKKTTGEFTDLSIWIN